MKKIILIALSITILFSCRDIHEKTGNSKNNSKKIVIETHSNYVSIQKTELINPNKHNAFLSGEVNAMIAKSNIYTRSSSANGTALDTIHDPTLLPIVKEYGMEEQVYNDGSSKKTINDNYVEEYCPILSLYSHPFDFSIIVAKIVYEDGMAHSYNNEGKLLNSMSYTMPDMTEAIDDIEQGQAAQAQTKNSGSSPVERAKEMFTKNVDENSIFKIDELDNGNILIEETYNGSTISPLGTSSDFTKSRTILTSDLKHTVMTEEYAGTQLVSKQNYYYTPKNKYLESHYTLSDGTIETKYNPALVISQQLIVKTNGSPMIQTTRKSYTRNQVIYNNLK